VVGSEARSNEVVVFWTSLALSPHLHELFVLIIAIHEVVRPDICSRVDANFRHRAIVILKFILFLENLGSTQNGIGTSERRSSVIRTIHVFFWTHLARCKKGLVLLIITTLDIIGGKVHKISGP
jgi:hypothetical protein